MDRLRKDLAKKDKQLEDKLKIERNAARNLSEQNNKLKLENSKLTIEVDRLTKENAQLANSLALASDAVNEI